MSENILSTIQLAKEIMDIEAEFMRKCGKVPGTRSSMLPSEIMAFCAACRAVGIDRVVESGRSYGYSTECLLRMGFNVISYDCAPIAETDARLSRMFPQCKLESTYCPAVVTTKSPFGLLLDGPKGYAALTLVDQSNPTVAAIHDCCGNAPVRPEIERRQWVTTDQLNPCEELDVQHLAERGLTRDVFGEAFVLGIARFLQK